MRAWILATVALATIAAAPWALAQDRSDSETPGTIISTAGPPKDTTAAWTEAAPENVDRLKKRLGRVVLALPRPDLPYQLAEDGASENVSAWAGLIKGTRLWAPIEALSGRDFEALPIREEEDGYRALDMMVTLNGVRGLSTGIASKSEMPQLFDLGGTVSVVQSTIGGVDSTRAELAPEERRPREPIILLRVYIVDPDLEAKIRQIFKESGGFPAFGPTQVPAAHTDMVRSIVVELFGPKSDVEATARKIDVGAVRKLLER
jgi:hypothetical protein